MQKKTIIRIVIIFFFTILLIGGGLVFFQRLQSDKRVYAIDLHNYIPKESKEVVEVRRESDLKNITIENKVSLLIESIKTEISYPFYLLNPSSKDHVIVAKLSSSQEVRVREVFAKSLFSTYPPQKRKYKDAEVLFYTTNNLNEFFVCSFYNGIFIAAHNYKLVQNIIDTDAPKSLFSIPFYKETEPFFKSESLVYYDNSDSLSMVFSLNLRDSLLALDGYVNQKIVDTTQVDSLVLDSSLFPLNYLAFQIEKKSSSIDESLVDIFKPPYYTFWIDSATVLSATKFALNRYDLYDTLNAIEKEQTGKNLFRHGYTIDKKYSIYNGSSLFNKKVFKTEKLIYFAFKDGYLLYSNDKEVLRRHILKTENLTVNLELKDMSETYFYSKNPSIVNHPLVKRLNLKSISGKKDLSLEIYPDVEYYKFEINAKHF